MKKLSSLLLLLSLSSVAHAGNVVNDISDLACFPSASGIQAVVDREIPDEEIRTIVKPFSDYLLSYGTLCFPPTTVANIVSTAAGKFFSENSFNRVSAIQSVGILLVIIQRVLPIEIDKNVEALRMAVPMIYEIAANRS